MLKRLLNLFNLFNKSSKKRFIVKGDITRIKIGSKTIIDSTVIFNNERGGTIEIGDNCRIYENVILATYGGNIKIGNHSSINPFCVLYGHGGLTIGDDLRMATHSIIIPANHIYENVDIPIRLQGLDKKGVIIEDNVWIGAGVKILDGVTIEKNSIIAAGAVVNKKVIMNSIVGGVPAKLIKIR
jgi:acetyltransferase-like isoleucine patch superfamily enzyme